MKNTVTNEQYYDLCKVIVSQQLLLDKSLKALLGDESPGHFVENIPQHIANMVEENRTRLVELERQDIIIDEKDDIIAAIMREVPVGNIDYHTPEFIAGRIGWYIQEYSKMCDVEDTLTDIFECDSYEEVIEAATEMKAENSKFKDALTYIKNGTRHSKELANKTLGWSGNEHEQIELLREDNLFLKLELEKTYNKLIDLIIDQVL